MSTTHYVFVVSQHGDALSPYGEKLIMRTLADNNVIGDNASVFIDTSPSLNNPDKLAKFVNDVDCDWTIALIRPTDVNFDISFIIGKGENPERIQHILKENTGETSWERLCAADDATQKQS